jgi:hypothetical protein
MTTDGATGTPGRPADGAVTGKTPGSPSNMATKQKLAHGPSVEASTAAERGEHWWPIALAIIVAAGLHVALPAGYRIQPTWVVPAVLLGRSAGPMLSRPRKPSPTLRLCSP